MALFPVDELEALLILKARAGATISYGGVFAWFGVAFQRFQVGQLCAALGEVDARQQARNRPPLAALVVRQSDGIPGQGWWLMQGEDRPAGPITGPKARAHIQRLHRRIFRHWKAAATAP
jgi:hypothetical protein